MKYLGKTLTIIGDKKFVVLPVLHQSRNLGPCYMVKEFPVETEDYRNCFGAGLYPVDDEAGNSQALEEYIARDIPIMQKNHEHNEAYHKEEERKRQEAERKAREEVERQRFHGFTDGMSPMQKGKIVKCLDRLYRYSTNDVNQGGIMSRAAWLEKMKKAGCTSTIEKDNKGKNTYWIYLPSRKGCYDVTKTEFDYFEFLSNR